MSKLPTLSIGNLKVNPPIIQGGMGVRISLSNLASAVANQGCVGVIATAGIGSHETIPGVSYSDLNKEALRKEIRNARKQSDGVIGVNIMTALSDYEMLVKTAAEEGADIIISGAGLPLDLPKYVGESDVKLIPIISSVRALKIICKKWKNTYKKTPDAIIIEGPAAGGHLGYKYEDVQNDTAMTLEEILAEVLPYANSFSPEIPVIVAGGIFDGADIAHFLKLGASGVQMATRFVCTHECDADIEFKKAYLNAEKEDITLIKSPVGMPGKVINNKFVEDISQGKKVPFKCQYRCLKSCDYKEAPYCIAEVLLNAAVGKLDQGFAFAGSKVNKCNEIISVEELVNKIKDEYDQEIKRLG